MFNGLELSKRARTLLAVLPRDILAGDLHLEVPVHGRWRLVYWETARGGHQAVQVDDAPAGAHPDHNLAQEAYVVARRGWTDAHYYNVGTPNALKVATDMGQGGATLTVLEEAWLDLARQVAEQVAERAVREEKRLESLVGALNAVNTMLPAATVTGSNLGLDLCRVCSGGSGEPCEDCRAARNPSNLS